MIKLKRGRPRLESGEKREVFALRLTDKERDVIETAAREAGLRVTDWARRALVSAALSQTE